MKGITLRSDGRYMIRKTINGVSYTKYAKTIKEAKRIYTKLKNNNLEEKEEEKIYTLKSWGDEWLKIYKEPFSSNQLIKDILTYLKKINSELGKINLKSLTASQIQTFLNNLPKNRTKEKIQIYFNAMLQKAEDLNLINKNPFKAVIKDKRLKTKNYTFTFDEQKTILEKIKNTKIEKEIYIYLMTGCRPNEIPQLKNFDFENNLIIINGTKNQNAKERIVEMSKNFADYIKPYILSNNRLKEKEISKQFIEICNLAKIKKPLLYRLRHTFASNHFTLGTPPKYVQAWLGHYSISLTLDTYTDIDKTSSKEKIRQLYNNFYFEKT